MNTVGTVASSLSKKTGIRWGRVLAAAVLSEVAVIAILMVATAIYSLLEKLGFKLVTDQPHDEKQRWIELRIGSSDTRFVLFTMDESRIGTSFNGALACDNVERTYQELKERGVKFQGPPKQEAWGTFAFFEDVDGNQFVLSSR